MGLADRRQTPGHGGGLGHLGQLHQVQGRQWVSWVALEDFVAAMVRAIDDDSMVGLYHVTSPNPITNAEMMATYRRLLGLC
jgi:NAD dependent epimerase/dehydratase family enzyme